MRTMYQGPRLLPRTTTLLIGSALMTCLTGGLQAQDSGSGHGSTKQTMQGQEARGTGSQQAGSQTGSDQITSTLQQKNREFRGELERLFQKACKDHENGKNKEKGYDKGGAAKSGSSGMGDERTAGGGEDRGDDRFGDGTSGSADRGFGGNLGGSDAQSAPEFEVGSMLVASMEGEIVVGAPAKNAGKNANRVDASAPRGERSGQSGDDRSQSGTDREQDDELGFGRDRSGSQADSQSDSQSGWATRGQSSGSQQEILGGILVAGTGQSSGQSNARPGGPSGDQASAFGRSTLSDGMYFVRAADSQGRTVELVSSNGTVAKRITLDDSSNDRGTTNSRGSMGERGGIPRAGEDNVLDSRDMADRDMSDVGEARQRLQDRAEARAGSFQRDTSPEWPEVFSAIVRELHSSRS